MTSQPLEDSDLLGSALPGVIALPNWRVKIARRTSSEVLVWRVAKSPAPLTVIKTGFSSLPSQVPPTRIKRGVERLRQRSQDGKSTPPLGADELLVTFRAAGGHIQLLRQIPPGMPPFFGGAGALDDFILLVDQPHAIEDFAAHWGPLGLCKHLVPWTHSLARRSAISTAPVCAPLGVVASQGRGGWEPLEKWRDYSRDARDITRTATALRNCRDRSEDQLGVLFWRVATWLELATVPLTVYQEIDRKKPWPCGIQVAPEITGVFQILALQLLGVVTGGRELADCSHCGLPFSITGHREGKRRFCPACVVKKIPMRYAAHDYRARQRMR